MPEFPPCFDSFEAYETWLYHAATSDLADPAKSICMDCTPEYQAEMIFNGRCQFPETKFGYVRPTRLWSGDDDELFLCGLSPAAYRVMARMKRLIPLEERHAQG